MDLGKNVAKNVRAIRLKQGMSQQQLADKTGLTVRYISRLENTAPNVTLDVLERISKGLGCSAAELLGEGSLDLGLKKSTEMLDQTIKFLQSIRSRV